MIVLWILLAVIVLIVVAAYITNPFARFSIVRQSYVLTDHADGFKAVNENHRLRLHQSFAWRWFTIMKFGVHFLTSRYIYSPGSSARTVDGIIADIHTHRYRPDKLLLISGDHFSPLFVRNLGIFYHPMLDARIADVKTKNDWRNRQVVYMQTLAYALGVFAKRPIPVTTIVTTGPRAATCVNFYAYPSDTVYGILFALSAALGKEQATPAADFNPVVHSLQTQHVAQELLDQYKDTLKKLYTHYRQTVYDNTSGLIRTNVHLSGAKDITRRRSAFFDNVIFWKTTQLAVELGLIPKQAGFLSALKKRILDTFWLPDKGYFLEDVSEEGKTHAYYSSDWLIVLITGFLSPADKREQQYFVRSVAHIQAEGIDKPFAIKYQNETRAHRQFFIVRLAVASYGGDAIWSFWGMEYIKTLLLLYAHTGQKQYLTDADFHIHAYERAMLRDHGFPEVYDHKGVMLQTPLYRSVRQTGWVIGFEQVRTLRAAVATKKRAGQK